MTGGYMDTDLRVLCVSYMWLTSSHPDPRGDTLALLARILERFVDDRISGGTWAVFLDYSSLPQLGVSTGGEENRAQAETVLLRGLEGLAALYSHPCTWTLKVSSLPSRALPPTFNLTPYEARGWCFTEACVSHLVKPYTQVLDVAQFTGSGPTFLGETIRECRAGRSPPLTPVDFDASLEEKTFTWRAADLPMVKRLYRQAFAQRFARATSLSYVDLGWGDAEVASLCRVLESGALGAAWRQLHLTGNAITDDGMRLLAASLRRVPVPADTDAAVVPPLLVELCGNQASHAAMRAVLEAAASRG